MASIIGKSIGRFHILEQLGQGGMAIVYKAYDPQLKRNVAIKMLRVDMFPPAALQRVNLRFEREAAVMARLDHPNIVRVLDYGEFEGAPFFVMDLYSGKTLKQIEKPVTVQQAASLLVPILSALEYAHNQGIVHRDIKPSNILLDKSNQPVLADFGIAKVLLSNEETITESGMGVGTPEYMAPEQALGDEIDWRCDLYALGIIFYELICGEKPFTANTPAGVLVKKVNAPLPWPRNIGTNNIDQVKEILQKTLTKQPQDRYKHIGDLYSDLQSLVGEQTGIQPDISVKTTDEFGPSSFEAKPDRTASDNQITRDDYLQNESVEQRKISTSKNRNGKGIIITIAIGFIAVLIVSGILLVNYGLRGLNGDIRNEPLISAESSMSVVENVFEAEQTDVITPISDTPISSDVIQLSNVAQLKEINQWDGYAGEMIGWKSDNTGLYTASQFRYGYLLFDISDNHPQAFHEDDTYIYMAAMGNNGELYATTMNDKTLQVWQHQANQPNFTKEFQNMSLVSLPEFSPENQWIVGYFEQQVQILSTTNGSLVFSIDFPLWNEQSSEEPMMVFAFSDNGNLLAIGSGNSGEIQIWDMEKMQQVQTIKWHEGVSSMAFSPDNQTLVSGSYLYAGTENIRVWHIDSGELMYGVQKNNEQVYGVDFSLDGEIFASGSKDGALRFWRTVDGTLIQTYHVDEDSISAVSFSPDGKYIVTAGQKIVVWGIDE